MNYEVVTTVVGIIITAAVSVVGYFLKRTMNRLDDFATKEDIGRIEKQVEEHKKDIKTLNDKYATKAELREIKEDIADMRASIEYLRENAIGREDFFRNIGMPTSLKELGLMPSEEQLVELAAKCAVSSGGKKGSAKVLREEDMLAIYRDSLESES